ncbi:MAG: acetoacetate--CoA ligase [Pirellula sp.]
MHVESVNSRILWSPNESTISQANITRFSDTFRSRLDISFGNSYAELHAASLRHPGEFWRSVWDYCGIIGDPGETNVVRSENFMKWNWFPSAQLNYAEAILKPARLTDPEFASSVAIVTANELGQRREINRLELCEQVCRFANFLKGQGVVAGDRIVAVVPNVAESVIAMLATTAIGAVWSSCSPEFGDDAICDRFSQTEPCIMITSSTTQYNGKQIRPIDKVARVLPRLRSIKSIVVIGDSPSLNLSIPQFSWFDACESSNCELAFDRFPFSHPLCILYSSGTTGVPKCIIHGVGGALLQHAKEHSLHCDLKPRDCLFYYTTTGWMMWNWLLSGLASEASVLLFDGSPLSPSSQVLWQLAASERVTHFGASPRYYMTLEKERIEPAKEFDLSRLRCVMSTGSPLLPETFDWIYRAIGSDMNLASISGGTDILSCFVLGNPTLPVYRGQIQCKGLGMDVRICNERGETVVGEPGELVCAMPFPSMPIGFWNDPENKKYKAAYFEKLDPVWCHGDWASETPQGGFVIFGRSDATLNPSGVRIGTAEIYQQIDSFPQIAECLATALRRDGDEQIVLFLKMANGNLINPALIEAIQKRLRDRCSARHVPAWIAAAPDLPKTISGKLSEIAVRRAISGSNLGNSGALANPECLEYFREWRRDLDLNR